LNEDVRRRPKRIAADRGVMRDIPEQSERQAGEAGDRRVNRSSRMFRFG